MPPRRRGPPAFDFRRFAKGIAGPDLDARHWVAYGTVASVNGEDGTPNFTDPNAVLVTPAGVEVDVVLEPINYLITCRHGIAAGDVFICGPIRPGDQVQVIIPDGDSSMIPEIVKVIPGSSNPIPLEEDGTPVFKNDRFLIMSKVPIEIRSTNGTMVRITDDLVEVGGAGVTEQAVLGTTQRSAEATLNNETPTGLQGIWNAAQAACVGPLAPLKPMFVAAALALNTYEGQADGFLSDTVKLK